MTPLTARQQDALREVASMGSAQAATMLARLVGDVGVLVDVPVVLAASPVQLAWLLGGHDVEVLSATFGIEGELKGTLWWVLRKGDASRLGQRLLKRPGVSGPLSSSASAALSEAANIVASACLSTLGNLLKAGLLPTTPTMGEGPVRALVGDGEEQRTVLASSFTSTNAPTFGGWLVLMLDEATTFEVVRRLKV